MGQFANKLVDVDITGSSQVGSRKMKPGSSVASLPGLGLPLGYLPGKDLEHGRRFPVLLDEEDLGWRANTLLRREVCMLKLMEELTNKPEWWRKVRDPVISAKWEKEAIEMDWTAFMPFSDFTPNMAKACISELSKKAELYEKTGLVPVMDYSACVLKSDSILEEDQGLIQALKSAVVRLEDVPEDEKDWHPGSDQKVLDLVHPSLWPLVYGKTRVLADHRIGLHDALESCGMGNYIRLPSEEELVLHEYLGREGYKEIKRAAFLSNKYQWLPCEVDLSGGRAKIESYINNLHPTDHADLYPIVERFIEKALPAWDLIYRWPSQFEHQRLICKSVLTTCAAPNDACDSWCKASNRPVDDDEPERVEDEEYEDDYEGSERESRDLRWYESTHHITLDDADPAASYLKVQSSDVKSSGFFNDASKIQVIVKLANIHLTPDRPTYDGGSWHIEGMLNEHICATALFYYDSDNITDCHLEFRTMADREGLVCELQYEQNETFDILRAFAINPGSDIIQDVGAVLTRPNRSLFFPNLYQHHVSPFRLANPEKPGHRKILALFLVDPSIPVISTANVPPQQRHWWEQQVDFKQTMVGQLPPEIRDNVFSQDELPMDEKQARVVREELMKERSGLQTRGEERLRQNEWNFCEH